MSLAEQISVRPTITRRASRSCIERDIKAEKAATMLRKGLSVEDVCAALKIGPKSLKQLGHDYDFPVPERRSNAWPGPDDSGLAYPSASPRKVWERAKQAAAMQLAANGYTAQAKAKEPVQKPVEIKVEQPIVWPKPQPPVPYDEFVNKPIYLPIRWQRIMIEVCDKHDVEPRHVLSAIRSKHIVRARNELFYRMRDELCLSWPKIGQLIGGKDHSTVIHGYRKHAAEMRASA